MGAANSGKDFTGIEMLSILIPSIPSRKQQMLALKSVIDKQVAAVKDVHPTLGRVQVLVDDSKTFLEGGLSIGKKREKLVSQAAGKYLCFLDDDESVSPSYVETLLRLCYLEQDVCTFRNISKLDNYWCIIDMGLRHKNEQASSDHMVRRRPWHICPVRSEFAKQFPFPDSNYGEDWVWFENVLKLCTSEAKTNEVIHQYSHSTKKSEADKINRAQL